MYSACSATGIVVRWPNQLPAMTIAPFLWVMGAHAYYMEDALVGRSRWMCCGMMAGSMKLLDAYMITDSTCTFP